MARDGTPRLLGERVVNPQLADTLGLLPKGDGYAAGLRAGDCARLSPVSRPG